MFGFGEKDPVPCSDHALKLASAVCGIVEAQKALDKAESKVPSYTAQWEPSDYCADAQEAFYRAAERLERIIGGDTYEVGDFVHFSTQRIPTNQPFPYGTIDRIDSCFHIRLLDERGRDQKALPLAVLKRDVLGLASRQDAMKLLLEKQRA